MPKAELIGLEAPETAHGSLVFALAQGPRQIQSCEQEVTLSNASPAQTLIRTAGIVPADGDQYDKLKACRPSQAGSLTSSGEKFGKASPCCLDCTCDERLAQSSRGDGGSSCRARD